MTPRARAEWTNRSVAEYRSAALAAQLVHGMIQVGLDESLIRTGLRVVGDELDHARLSAELAEALGGDGAPQPVDVASLAFPQAPEGPLASLLDSLLVNFLLGETFAVPLFDAMRRGARHAGARAVLERICRDEAVHRAFGWDVFDAVLAIDPEGARARVQGALPGHLLAFERTYRVGDGDAVGEEEVAVGLLPLPRWGEIHRATVDGELRRRFGARGVSF